MNQQLAQDLDQLSSLLEQAQTQGIRFLDTINQRPTSVNPPLPTSSEPLPDEGIGAEATLQRFNATFEPIIVSSAGPRYWGFVTGGTTPASIMGDWLATVYDQNTQSVEGQGDISAVIERETIRLLLDLFRLPGDYLGGFVTGATMSNFTCLGVARQWLGQQQGKDVAKEGVTNPFDILTATPHSSALKCLSLLGMGSSTITRVSTLPGNREAMDTDALEETIQSLGSRPFILISSGGTVNTVDFDDCAAIARLKQKYSFWWHIDAAFGGLAACSPQHRHLLAGWEAADSITIDCHKWLNVPYENAFYLVKERHRHAQIETFQNSNAPYLGDPLEHFDYLNFLPENSRRLKALPVWFTLLAYGRQGYQDIVENNVALAQRLGALIKQSAAFELLAPVRLNTVCFTVAHRPEDVARFLTRLNASGQVFMTPTTYRDSPGIRAALVNWRTTEADVAMVFEQMKQILGELASSSSGGDPV